MDDRFAVDVVKVCHEFDLGSDPDVTQHRPRHLGEEPLHEIEPGTVLGREHERGAMSATASISSSEVGSDQCASSDRINTGPVPANLIRRLSNAANVRSFRRGLGPSVG
jgi:hypothetical protein